MAETIAWTIQARILSRLNAAHLVFSVPRGQSNAETPRPGRQLLCWDRELGAFFLLLSESDAWSSPSAGTPLCECFFPLPLSLLGSEGPQPVAADRRVNIACPATSLQSLFLCIRSIASAYWCAHEGTCTLQASLDFAATASRCLADFLRIHTSPNSSYEECYEPASIQPPGWYCGRCAASFDAHAWAADDPGETALIVRQLPSRNWQDLVECWSCHQHHHSDLSHKMMNTRFTCPPPGVVYSSSEEWIVLPWQYEAAAGPVYCGNCRFILGTCDGSALHLSKQQVNLRPGQDPDRWALLAHQLLERVHADSRYRFAFAPGDFSPPIEKGGVSSVLLIWILNPEMYIATWDSRSPRGADAAACGFSKAMQVAFRTDVHDKAASCDADVISFLDPEWVARYSVALEHAFDASLSKATMPSGEEPHHAEYKLAFILY